MLLEGLERISQAEIEDRIPMGQGPGASTIEELASEIADRAKRAPTSYPFRSEEEEIFVKPEVDASVYHFLCILSMDGVPYKTQSRYNDIGPYLELITREAGKAFLGDDAEGVRFGYPNDDGRPEHLIAAVEWLATLLKLDPTEVLYKEVDEDDKDGGVDVAVWNGLGDNHPAFPVYLFQCTVQARWEKKAPDVVPAQWASWINFGMEPSIGLAVPHFTSSDAKVRARNKYTTQVLLDRFRLADQSAKRDLTQFPEYEQMIAWTQAEIALILEELSNPSPGRSARRKKPRIAKGRSPVKSPEAETKGLPRSHIASSPPVAIEGDPD